MKSLDQAVPLMAIVMLVLLVSPSSVAAITCDDVIQKISPCAGYLSGAGGGGRPSEPCCDGAKALAAALTTTAERQTACGCLKTAFRSMNVNPAVATELPGNCGISLSISISPNADCSTIG